MKLLIFITILLGMLSACGDKDAVDLPSGKNIPKQASKRSIQVTSLNIEWFGIGGRMTGNPTQETRDDDLKKYFKSHFAKTDVFVFQEIIDEGRLQKTLPGFKCHTYDRHNPRHQHVVICAKKIFTQKTKTYESVDLKNPGLRPAQMLELTISQDFQVQIIGLHLKARPDGTQVRLDQIKALKSEMDANSNAILIGDFNTYHVKKTGMNKDDDELITDLLGEDEFSQAYDDVGTYLGRDGLSQFDRAWVRNLNTLDTFVHGPCDENTRFPYNDVSYYVKNISDHCPVTVVVGPQSK